MRCLRGSVLVVVACIVACWKPFAPARPLDRDVVFRAETVRLDSGARVVVIEDSNALEVEVTARYQVGEIDDPRGREGMAHLVEHLMFQPVVERESLYAQLERVSTSFNGFTELETTTFTARGAPATLERLLAIEAARLSARCAAIPSETFVREREVVRNELRQKATALEVRTNLYAALFPDGHPYRAAIETPDTVAAIRQDEACAFADAHYTPDQMVVVVSGPVTHASVARLARAAFDKASRAGRPAVTRTTLAPIAPGSTKRKAPLEADVVIAAWPLPDDVATRAHVRALTGILADQVDVEVQGSVAVQELGGARAPVIMVAVEVAPDETASSVRAIVEQHIQELPGSFSNNRYYDDTFEHARQSELHDLLATLEDGGGRHAHVANHVLANRDASTAVATEMRALTTIERDAATALARRLLRLDATRIVVLEADRKHRVAQPLGLAAPVRDEGIRRVVADPDEATRPARPFAAPSLSRASRRTLANGIRVVLLPLGSLPTVEVRFVFDAGMADDGDRSGVAMLAAHALTPDPSDAAELIRFYEAGGQYERRVGLDHTTFAVRGLERDLDRLLTGLERLVRGGDYRSAAKLVEQARRSSATRDETAREALWRTALYGPSHPYQRAGSLRTAELSRLDAAAAAAFRGARYRPHTLTVIVAGGFDPVTANRWIDHLLAAWTNDEPVAPRAGGRARLAPTALAIHDDTAQVRVHAVLPVEGTRAQLLVAAEMIDQAIADVRHQLAASYGVDASVEEDRLARRIELVGYIDAARAREAFALIRARLASLRDPDAATASRFASARRRVLGRLASVQTSAAALADLAEQSVVLGVPPTSEVESVRLLTLRDLAPVLGKLELADAAIRMRGPTDHVQRAYETLGRTPKVVP